MTSDDKIKNDKLEYHVHIEAAKISALSSSKIDKYEHLTCAEILFINQSRLIEQDKLTYFPLGTALEKQRKTIEDQGRK